MAIEQLENRSALEEVLDFMEERFDGDLDALVALGIEYSKKRGLARGPLWDEVGEQSLRVLYRQRRILNKRHAWVGGLSTASLDNQKLNDKPLPSVKPTEENPVFMRWYSAGGKWYQLGDMTKKECVEVAKHYEYLAKSNAHECQFFNDIVGRFSNEVEKVRDILTAEEILEMRKTFSRE